MLNNTEQSPSPTSEVSVLMASSVVVLTIINGATVC